MNIKLLAIIRTVEDARVVEEAGCEVLAKYSDGWLIYCTEQAWQVLQEAGIEAVEIEGEDIRIGGMSFAFDQVQEANEAVPVEIEPDHVASYIVKLVGPAKKEWIDTVGELGGVVRGSLGGFNLLIGILPSEVQKLEKERWLEGVTLYRPAMKVSPQLYTSIRAGISAVDLMTIEMDDDSVDAGEAVEIDVFPGEDTAAIAELVRGKEGFVLSETPTEITACVTPRMIKELAHEQGVVGIRSHGFPALQNDCATRVMGVFADHTFGDQVLRGEDQIVGIADSGLDTGDLDTLHDDIRGRVVGLVPWSNRYPHLSKAQPSFENIPKDEHSGHGTHVTGSVIGNGSVARVIESPYIPQGVAPEAQAYFQAVEKQVNWKSESELRDEGYTDAALMTLKSALSSLGWSWPLNPLDLWGLPANLIALFDEAYEVGVRIHTNSWAQNTRNMWRTYSAWARQVDEFMWTHRDMLILFAAGNCGVDEDQDGIIDRGSICPPGTAKNCLTVGASENDRPPESIPTPGRNGWWIQAYGLDGGGHQVQLWPTLFNARHVSDNPNGMAAFSSRGPTGDNRIKPDVVAPGTNILSTRSSECSDSNNGLSWGELAGDDPLHGFYHWFAGTSMSTPLVAGAAALVRQHLVKYRGHFQVGLKPSGALLKAFLVNGAEHMHGHFPGEIPAGQNVVSGFGRVNLKEALAPGGQQALFADEPDLAVGSGQTRAFDTRVIDTTRPLKVTLVWTDAPEENLQNQLYLRVRPPRGITRDGNTSAHPIATNNVQQIIFDPPVGGVYEILVDGRNVIAQAPGAVSDGYSRRQDFALVVSNAAYLKFKPGDDSA